jgi:hypothetical protein
MCDDDRFAYVVDGEPGPAFDREPAVRATWSADGRLAYVVAGKRDARLHVDGAPVGDRYDTFHALATDGARFVAIAQRKRDIVLVTA